MKEQTDRTSRWARRCVAVFLIVSFVMGTACLQFYQRYRDHAIETEQNQLLTIAGIIGGNLNSYINEQLDQIDLACLDADADELGSRIEYVLTLNGDLYCWAILQDSEGVARQYYAQEDGAIGVREPLAADLDDMVTSLLAARGTDVETEATIVGKQIPTDSTWYEMYIRRRVQTPDGDYTLLLAMNLQTIYQEIVHPVRIGTNGYSVVKDKDLSLIMHHVPSQLGLDAAADRKVLYPQLDLTALEDWVNLQRVEDSGATVLSTYVWDDPDLRAIDRIVAYQAIYIQGERWIVNSTLPVEELDQPLDNMMRIVALIALTYMAVVLVAVYLIIRWRYLAVSQRQEIQHLKELNQGMELLTRKNNELRHAQRLQSLGMMASHIAHEFNNYLTPVLIYTELLQGDETISAENRAMLGEMANSIDQAANLSQDLLAFSRQDTGIRLERLDYVQEVHVALKMVRHLTPAAITLHTDIAEGPLYIQARRGMAEHILLNLCKNAFQAMESSEVKELTISLQPSGDHSLCLSVSDTGCGIDEAAMDKIFEPFYTTKGSRQGTGLGLSVVRNQVTSVGGSIQIHSEPGKGTRFDLEIPLDVAGKDQEPGKKEPDTNASAKTGPHRIVIVSTDSKLSRLRTKTTTQVIEVRNHPAPVVSAVQRNPEIYDAVIADYELPAMNGIELCEVIRRIAPHVGLVLMSELHSTEYDWYLNNGMIDQLILRSELDATHIAEIASGQRGM